MAMKNYIPNINNIPVVNHIDHNKTNYSISNLEWVSSKDNTKKYLEFKMKLKNSVLSHNE